MDKALLTELQSIIAPEKENLTSIAREIWENPELGLQEVKAAKLLTDQLKKYGFAVEIPYAGLETAFRAELQIGNGGGVFALAAEYDALAGIGHACGHNTSGVASIGAAYAAKCYLEKHNLAGKIIVLGTPAEEGVGGKVKMLRNADCLKGIDAVMMAHAAGNDKTKVDGGSTGVRRYDVIFRGKAAHAAGSPDKGINALDAQILLFNAIGLYRQQMSREGIIHGIIAEGGEAANVIPDHTVSRLYIRSKQEAILEEVYERFTKMVEGAALMTGTTYEIKMNSEPCKARKPNAVLNKLFLDGAKMLGTMGACDDIPSGRGSSDFGDFSQAIPGAHPYFGLCTPGGEEAAGHSELFKSYANSDYGYARMIDAATVLAMCAVRVVTEPALRKEIRAAFDCKA